VCTIQILEQVSPMNILEGPHKELGNCSGAITIADIGKFNEQK